MDATSILAGRLQVAFAHFHIGDEVVRAFRAAYLVRCEAHHLGESIQGQDARGSIRAAVDVALRGYATKPDALPANVQQKLADVPPRFRETMIDVVPEVDAFTLKLLPQMATIDGFDVLKDEDLLRFVEGCMWYYVERAEISDPF